MGVVGMPPAEVAIDHDLVRRLLAEQHPDLVDLPLTFLAEGWDNVLFRLGPNLVVRLPRRELAVVLVEHEHRWLAELAPGLPLPTPVPIRRGVPGPTFPWPWTIAAWVDGVRVADAQLADPPTEAARLGGFLAALHHPAPDGAPRNEFRGVPLAARHDTMVERFELLDGVLDVGALALRWDESLQAEAWTGPPLWLHGDLHPANLVADGGCIVSVIDWGDITAGDPATDLAVAWMLFGADDRAVLRVAAEGGAGGVDDHTWRRARGWAVAMATAYVLHSADNEAMGRIGHRTVERIVEDPWT